MNLADVGAYLDGVLAAARCRVRGHDWRVWSVVGHPDIVSVPTCERCGRTATGKDDAAGDEPCWCGLPEGHDLTDVYWCPTAGEYESASHGGFTVCCDRPDLHRATEGPS